MQFDVIDPRTKKLVRTLPCDAGTRAFAVLDKERLAYIYEDAKGELILKEVSSLPRPLYCVPMPNRSLCP